MALEKILGDYDNGEMDDLFEKLWKSVSPHSEYTRAQLMNAFHDLLDIAAVSCIPPEGSHEAPQQDQVRTVLETLIDSNIHDLLATCDRMLDENCHGYQILEKTRDKIEAQLRDEHLSPRARAFLLTVYEEVQRRLRGSAD